MKILVKKLILIMHFQKTEESFNTAVKIFKNACILNVWGFYVL